MTVFVYATQASRSATPSTSRCSPIKTPRRHGSRKTTRKALPSNMRFWNRRLTGTKYLGELCFVWTFKREPRGARCSGALVATEIGALAAMLVPHRTRRQAAFEMIDGGATWLFLALVSHA